MSKRFVFVFSLSGNVEAVRATLPAHVDYWTRADVGYASGRFADRSGGLLSFRASDLAAADALVAGDPFVLRGLVRDRWTAEWARPEPRARAAG